MLHTVILMYVNSCSCGECLCGRCGLAGYFTPKHMTHSDCDWVREVQDGRKCKPMLQSPSDHSHAFDLHVISTSVHSPVSVSVQYASRQPALFTLNKE